ncbi:MAG TPA: F0F1 ATP synthase subunit B [Acidimicrobiales bacterium]|nr:F0F1 ATP synthase subunit B [Acidimicrobiales bacterium]
MLADTSSTPNFILPNATILVEVVLFLVVLGIVNAFVLKPVQRVIAEREETIRSGLQARDSAQSEAAELEQARRAVLEEARAEARGLIEAATRAAEELRATARDDGQQEHDRLIAGAAAEIDRQREQVRSDVLSRVETMVGEAASRVAGVPIDAARHRDLIQLAVAAAEGN